MTTQLHAATLAAISKRQPTTRAARAARAPAQRVCDPDVAEAEDDC